MPRGQEPLQVKTKHAQAERGDADGDRDGNACHRPSQYSASVRWNRSPLPPPVGLTRRSWIAGSSPSMTLGLGSGQHHDFALRLVLLHAAVRLDDLVETEGPADLDVQPPGGDLPNQFIERGRHEILC